MFALPQKRSSFSGYITYAEGAGSVRLASAQVIPQNSCAFFNMHVDSVACL
jgi:hypothetical protein